MTVHDMGSIELAMRVLERVRQAIHRSGEAFIMSDVAAAISADYGCAESTAFRHVRKAVDVLGIHYDDNSARKALVDRRREDAAQAGQRAASARGWPNGRPGPRDSGCREKWRQS